MLKDAAHIWLQFFCFFVVVARYVADISIIICMNLFELFRYLCPKMVFTAIAAVFTNYSHCQC